MLNTYLVNNPVFQSFLISRSILPFLNLNTSTYLSKLIVTSPHMTESHSDMVVFVNNDWVLVDGNLLDRCLSGSQLAVVVLLCLGHGTEDGRLLLSRVSSLNLRTQLQFLKYPVCEFLISFCSLEGLIS